MNQFKEELRVIIPDLKFREILKDKYGLVFDSNKTIAYQAVREIRELQISNSKISSLEGIEMFSSLELLNCADNLLTNLDVSQNFELEKLNCPNNKLNHLDISNNIKLQVLVCSSNDFKTLNVSCNHNLRSLYCEQHIEIQY